LFPLASSRLPIAYRNSSLTLSGDHGEQRNRRPDAAHRASGLRGRDAEGKCFDDSVLNLLRGTHWEPRRSHHGVISTGGSGYLTHY
jgi:hypothetical protein